MVIPYTSSPLALPRTQLRQVRENAPLRHHVAELAHPSTYWFAQIVEQQLLKNLLVLCHQEPASITHAVVEIKYGAIRLPCSGGALGDHELVVGNGPL